MTLRALWNFSGFGCILQHGGGKMPAERIPTRKFLCFLAGLCNWQVFRDFQSHKFASKAPKKWSAGCQKFSREHMQNFWQPADNFFGAFEANFWFCTSAKYRTLLFGIIFPKRYGGKCLQESVKTLTARWPLFWRFWNKLLNSKIPKTCHQVNWLQFTRL